MVKEARRLLRNGRFRSGALKELYPLLAEILDGRLKDGFTYPVVVCDHDEGRSVTDSLAVTGVMAASRIWFGSSVILRSRLCACPHLYIRWP
jgi:hypothetical protein